MLLINFWKILVAGYVITDVDSKNKKLNAKLLFFRSVMWQKQTIKLAKPNSLQSVIPKVYLVLKKKKLKNMFVLELIRTKYQGFCVALSTQVLTSTNIL